MTPLQILCGYLAVSFFQPLNFMDRIYPILICIFLAVYGFVVLPNIYWRISMLPYGTYIYYYIFPFLDFVVELISDILILQL